VLETDQRPPSPVEPPPIEPPSVADEGAPAQVDSGTTQVDWPTAAAEYGQALAKVMDPTADPGPALRRGLRAVLRSDTIGLMGWKDLSDLEGSSDLAISARDR
jgi:hypothetical protein